MFFNIACCLTLALLSLCVKYNAAFRSKYTLVSQRQNFKLHVRSVDKKKNSEVFKEENLLSSFITAPITSSAIQKLASDSLFFKKPEVLAPAGGWEQLKAAAANGADACYFGLQEGFNARARANNFRLDELSEVMDYLHDRGMKGYLVVNILVFDSELFQFQKIMEVISNSGVDALIMQDVGAVSYVRKLAPNLPIHGSTQMTITDCHGSLFAGRLGIDRIVVGRELSINDIKSVCQQSPDIEVEAFVHGALCVSYSGQCFSSEAWGGRSANRGQCAQACRMPYGLIVNGSLTELYQDVKYLLSPQDLMAVDYVPELIQAGVRSFKIEGRLKGPEYVAITTRAYRNAIDEVWNKMKDQLQDNYNADNSLIRERKTIVDENIIYVKQTDSVIDFTKVNYQGPDDKLRRDLLQVFSRGQDENYNGLSVGFLNGVRHQSLVRGNAPRKRGIFIGKVVDITSQGITIKLAGTGPVKRGDGLVFDRGNPEELEEGGSAYEVFLNGKSLPKSVEVDTGVVLITFARNALDKNRISIGDSVWRNKDPALENRLKEDLVNQQDSGLVSVNIKVTGQLNQPVEIQIMSRDGYMGVGVTNNKLATATKSPITKEDIIKSIGKLGGTPFTLTDKTDVDKGDCGVDMSQLDFSNTFIPMSDIKQARRDAVENLVTMRRQHTKNKDFNKDPTLLQQLRQDASITAINAKSNIHATTSDDSNVDTKPTLSVLCRTPLQVMAACQIDWVQEIILDFLEVHGIRDAVKLVQNAKKIAIVATPRIIKPDESKLINFYLRLKPDVLLIRSAGVFEQLLSWGGTGTFVPAVNTTIPLLRGDFSLNVANSLSAGLFLKLGLDRVTPTLDLNAQQIIDMAEILNSEFKTNNVDTAQPTVTPSLTHDLLGSSKLECIIHNHLPIFHTEYCVFCRFLSSGNNYTDCGHPCEKNHVSLRSMEGEDHLVLADQGCRNTVFNAKAQTGAEYIPSFIQSGIRHFRIELVDELPEYVAPLLNGYKKLLESTVFNKDNLVTKKPSLDTSTSQSNSLKSFYKWLNTVPNNYGRAQGYTLGSLKPSAELDWKNMKPTASASGAN